MTPRKRIGARIRALRQNLDLSLEQLAAAAGVDELDLDDWEDGLLVPSVEEAIRVARAVYVPADVLFDPCDSPLDAWFRIPAGV